MPIYSYKAADSAGKVVKGTIEASDERAVASKLHAMEYIPIRISNGNAGAGKVGLAFSTDVSQFFERITGKDTMLFTQDLFVLLDAGLPVDRSLSILVDAVEKDKFKDVIKDILQKVKSGSSLSEALGKYPKIFPPLYVNMVRAGEAGGVLPPVLDRLGQFLESSQDLKDYIKSSMVYPLFLLFVGGVSIIIMLTFVIPKFSVIFGDMGRSIPLSTQFLLALSSGLRNYWWLFLIAVGCGYYAFKQYVKTTAGRLKIDALKLRIPVVDKLIKSVEVARFSRTLGTLMQSGVPILQGLALVRDIVGNQKIVKDLQHVCDRVEEGEKLAVSIEQMNIFPLLAVQMISVGEETGKLDYMLLKVAENYEKYVKNIVKRLVNLLEPIMILVMGLVVGFIVISMLMAIFSINEIPF